MQIRDCALRKREVPSDGAGGAHRADKVGDAAASLLLTARGR